MYRSSINASVLLLLFQPFYSLFHCLVRSCKHCLDLSEIVRPYNHEQIFTNKCNNNLEKKKMLLCLMLAAKFLVCCILFNFELFQVIFSSFCCKTLKHTPVATVQSDINHIFHSLLISELKSEDNEVKKSPSQNHKVLAGIEGNAENTLQSLISRTFINQDNKDGGVA